MVDLSKYLSLFISESREILTQFQSELLKLEQGQAGPEAVDAMFRAAHSLKGMAASMGFDSFTELSHAIEDLASDARSGGELNSDAVDLMLEGVDMLETAVEQLDGGAEQPFCEAVDLIERIARQHRRAKNKNADSSAGGGGRATSSAVKSPAQPAPAAGLRQIAVRFSAAAKAPQVRAFMLQRQLGQKTEIVRLQPAIEDLRAGRFQGRRLILDLRVDEATLASLIDDARSFTDVEEVEELRSQAPPRVESSSETEGGDTRTVRVRTAILDEFIDSVGELLRARDRLQVVAAEIDRPEILEIAQELEALTKDLHARVMQARMTPLSMLTERLPRVVRDLARKKGHKVELRVEGADIEMDRALLDELHSAMLHIVRNAVDHGHEGASAREAAGKSPIMLLVVRARRNRDQVLIDVEDNGRGLDAEVLRNKAVEKGLLDEAHAEALSNAEAFELICRPGFSTAQQVTEISGRGVGMDAVRSAVVRLGGDLQIHSERGKGTRFTLQLPLTMAIIGVMLVQVGETTVAIPTSRVNYARDFEHLRIDISAEQEWTHIDGKLVQFFDLSQLLGYPRSGDRDTPGTLLILDEASGRAAVRVDRIVGLQEVVVKPLGAPLARLDYLAGAALLADGQPVYILDATRLIRKGVRAA